jgi:hypothetical protein
MVLMTAGIQSNITSKFRISVLAEIEYKNEIDKY